MFRRFWVAFAMIFNRNRIPPLPRGFASEYTHLDEDSRRVIARYGARDPKGVKLAMKQYGVQTVDELVSLLGHHRAKREVLHRLKVGFGRLIGGVVDHDPYAEQFRKLSRNDRKTRATKEVQQRVKRVRKSFEEKRS